MTYPNAQFLGLTWVGWVNFLLLQWFFIRMQGVTDENYKIIGWELRFTLPLTGWWSGYFPKRSPWSVWSVWREK